MISSYLVVQTIIPADVTDDVGLPRGFGSAHGDKSVWNPHPSHRGRVISAQQIQHRTRRGHYHHPPRPDGQGPRLAFDAPRPPLGRYAAPEIPPGDCGRHRRRLDVPDTPSDVVGNKETTCFAASGNVRRGFEAFDADRISADVFAGSDEVFVDLFAT